MSCRLKLLAAAVAALLTLTSCTADDDPPPEPPTSALTASTPTKLPAESIDVAVPYPVDGRHVGLFYAADKAYFTGSGLSDVEFVPTASPVVDQLVDGSAQIALADVPSVAAAITQKEAGLKIVATTYQKSPLAVVSLVDGADITALAGLKGRRIGVQESHLAAFKALLAVNGIAEADVAILPLSTGGPDPMMNGVVDAEVSDEVLDVPAVQLAGYEVASLPFADNGLPSVAQSIVTTDAYLADHAAAVTAFLTGAIKGWDDFVTSAPDDAAKVVAGHFVPSPDAAAGPLDLEDVKADLRAERPLIVTPQTQAAGLLTISDALKQQTIASMKLLGYDLTVEQLFDTSPLDAIYLATPALTVPLP